MSTESDRLLVQRVRANEPGAWDDLFKRYQGRLAAYVRRRLRDHAAVDDVVQNTFVGFLNSLPNYDDRRDLQTWLFTIAAHKVTDQLRKTGRRPYATGSEADEEQLGRAADDRQRPASSLARSAERKEREEDALGDALKAIAADLKGRGEYTALMALELLFVKGLGNKDVAARLKLPEQTVANLKFQAKKRLQDHLKAADLSVDVFPELTAAG
jgi:RNA polymerase sigma-70 factor (ECF subfamily)